MSHPKTALLLPCYNEEGRIHLLLERLAEVHELVDEIVVVDDGSTDGTLEEIRSGPVECTILSHDERRGLGEVIRTYYRHVLEGGHEVAAIMAANGKDDPRDLHQVLAPIFEGRADYVQGSRWHPDGGESRDLPLHRGLAIRLFTRVIAILYRQRMTDCSNGFRAYRTELLRDPRVDWNAAWQGVSYQVEIYLLLTALRLGYQVVEVPVKKIYPRDGKAYSKARAVDWWNMVKPIVWCSLGLDRIGGRQRAGGESATRSVPTDAEGGT